MHVVAMPAKDDMSSNLRVRWPAETLAAQGATVEIADKPWQVRERNRQIQGVRGVDCDVIVLCRPQHENVAKSIPLLQAQGIAVVVDYDDDLTSVHRQNHAVAAFDPATNPRSNWKWALLACEYADLVTVSTPALLDVYAKHGRGMVIPNRIPARRVPTRPEYSGEPRLGWAGFIGTHPTDLPVMGGAIAQALRPTGAPFRVIGPEDPRIARQVGWHTTATGLIPFDEWTPTIAANLDIGVSPAEDSAFNQGKSCLRVLEGCAAGVAMVASPIPDNRRAAADGMCLLAENRRQWVGLLRRMMTDDAFRIEQAQRGHDAVHQHLLEPHVDDWWSAWCTALDTRRGHTSHPSDARKVTVP